MRRFLLPVALLAASCASFRTPVPEVEPVEEPPVCDMARLKDMDATLFVNGTRLLVMPGTSRNLKVCFIGAAEKIDMCVPLREVEEYARRQGDARP